MSDNRNPFLIPDQDPTRVKKACPKCGSQDYGGTSKMDMIDFKCNACGNTWSGGLPRERFDPRKPIPPVNPKDIPPVDLVYSYKEKQYKEIRRSVDLTQEFRKGALIPEEDDNNEW